MKPLAHLRVLELAGLAPVPMLGMLLQDFGARVTRLDKPKQLFPDPLARGKRSLIVDTGKESGRAFLRELVGPDRDSAPPFDVILDPFRPGVFEKLLSSSPDPLPPLRSLVHSSMIVARLSGYGHALGSPYRKAAGHDLNYLASSGILSFLRAPAPAKEGKTVVEFERPLPPSNLLADFGGGSLLAFAGVLMAALAKERGSIGPIIVDASMTAGAAYMGTLLFQLAQFDKMNADGAASSAAPLANSPAPFLVPGFAPYYDCFPTGDDRFVAVAAIEPHFFTLLVLALKEATGSLPFPTLVAACSSASPSADAINTFQTDKSHWPALRQWLSETFRSRPLAFWTALFRPDGPFRDACVTPVLTAQEAVAVLGNGRVPSPAPLITAAGENGGAPRHNAAVTSGIVKPGAHTRAILSELGLEDARIEALLREGVVIQS